MNEEGWSFPPQCACTGEAAKNVIKMMPTMTSRHPRRRLCYLPLILSILLLNILETQAFQAHVLRTQRRRASFLHHAAQDENDKQDDKNITGDASEQFGDWLDKPFFDPMDYDEDDDSSWQARLANFVKSDYNSFELVYAGTFLAFMLVVSQELFRVQLYGADYVPFTSNSQTVNALWKSM